MPSDAVSFSFLALLQHHGRKQRCVFTRSVKQLTQSHSTSNDNNGSSNNNNNNNRRLTSKVVFANRRWIGFTPPKPSSGRNRKRKKIELGAASIKLVREWVSAILLYPEEGFLKIKVRCLLTARSVISLIERWRSYDSYGCEKIIDSLMRM